jgi:hypothetical protein
MRSQGSSFPAEDDYGNQGGTCGPREVRRFFEGIIRRLEITAFDTTEFVVQGDMVVVIGSE